MIAVEVMQTIIDTLERIVDRNRIDKKLEEAADQHEGIRNLLGILNTSEERVRRLRERAGNAGPPSKAAKSAAPMPADNVISLDDYALVPGIYKTAAERSVVLLRDPSSFIPAGQDRKCAMLPVEFVPSGSLKHQDISAFTGIVQKRFAWWDRLDTVVDFERGADGEIEPVFRPPERVEWVEQPNAREKRPERVPFRLPDGVLLMPIFSARGAPSEDFMEALTEFVYGHGAPFVIVTGWPIVEWVPESAGCLVTFGASPQVAAAVSAILAGEAEAQGLLDRVL
jgi:hypothetical protein